MFGLDCRGHLYPFGARRGCLGGVSSVQSASRADMNRLVENFADRGAHVSLILPTARGHHRYGGFDEDLRG